MPVYTSESTLLLSDTGIHLDSMLFIAGIATPKEDLELSVEEKELIMGGNISKEPVKVIPWKLILSKPPVWALIVCHFCHNWGTSILLTWMPTYYNQVLKFNLTESGLLCVLPWLTMAIFANIGGWIAESAKVSLQGSDAFSQSGLYSNHQDIGPHYAGVLLGLSNTSGVLAGVFGTIATGYILQRGSWDDVFKKSRNTPLFGNWPSMKKGNKNCTPAIGLNGAAHNNNKQKLSRTLLQLSAFKE
ncbi:hypothetical protein EV2_010879 [Malus domestica]